ncbi:hypothetical protein HPB48_020876 [Haemaphysalis longicornis]|uniref:AP-3 complex subunit delta domain-containing protein n=1 Tax=Haemaphysalis longicornis TaxID=44386 RepID=A0A9J6FVY4_HAELO|nr:hypothetical protein HPB48_020876 [Haemaphysalis longicornis]
MSSGSDCPENDTQLDTVATGPYRSFCCRRLSTHCTVRGASPCMASGAIFGALTPLEPRLGKKLIEPLTNLIHSTSAMSLLYECINTVIAVKYLGLLAMSKILKTHPRSVQAHKDLVLQCLDDKDESIRLRALDLLYGMVSKKNLMEIVKKLMVHMDRAEGTGYRDELLSKIIDICSQNNYQYITNFEWYVSVLVELTRIEGTKHGLTIASQMLDVAVRVQAVRAFSVSQMAVLLDNTHLLVGSGQRNSICEVLYAAAWICGEYSDLLMEPRSTLEALVRPRASQLPPHIQSAYVHNALKLWARLVAQEEEEGEGVGQQAAEGEGEPGFPPGGLQPAAVRAAAPVCAERRPGGAGESLLCPEPGEAKKFHHWSIGDLVLVRVFFFLFLFLGGRSLTVCAFLFQSANGHLQGAALDDIPVTEIDLSVPLHIPGLISSDKYLSASRKEREVADGKERRKKASALAAPSETDEEEEQPGPLGVVNTSVGEMPEGARFSDDDDDDRNADDPHRALDIDLEQTLKRSIEKRRKDHHHKSREHKKRSQPVEANHSEESHEVGHVEELEAGKGDKAPAGVKRSGRKKHHEGDTSKGSKKKKQKSSSKGTMLLQQDTPKDKREYEETPGITTPSKEPGFSAAQTPMTPCMPPPASNYKLLADDKNIKLMYEVRTLPMVRNQVLVSVIFTNQSPFQLKEMELNILDTLNTKMLRGVGASPHDGIKVPFQLPTGTANEGQFAFSVESISMPQRLRGTLTYMLMASGSSLLASLASATRGNLLSGRVSVISCSSTKGFLSSTHEKLDFKLHLPVSSYLMGTMSKRETFAELLSGSELSAKSSITLDGVDFEFSHVLSKICFHCRFSVVEQVALSASLYSRSIQDDHLCLLVKHMNPNRVLVDGKSTNSQLLSSLLDEVRTLLSPGNATSST